MASRLVERWVIGSILIDNDCLPAIKEFLRAEHFEREEHRLMYQAILSIQARGQPVDSLLLEMELRGSGTLEVAGGLEGIIEALCSVPHGQNAMFYAQAVKESWDERGVP